VPLASPRPRPARGHDLSPSHHPRRERGDAPSSVRARASTEVATCVIASPEELAREGLRALLARTGRVRFAGIAAHSGDLAEVIARGRPQLVVIHHRPSSLDGILAAQRVLTLHPACRVMLLVDEADHELIRRAREVGIVGMLSHGDARATTVADAVAAVLAGEEFIDRAIQAELMSRERLQLTAREVQVLTLLADGLGNPEAAQALEISPETVKTYVGRILAKLGAQTRTQAVAIAMRANVIA
jgi:DNA-binding NarL/FixJ family response regulator